jgi:CubicO group peptidase (beta-lactamase class C family)
MMKKLFLLLLVSITYTRQYGQFTEQMNRYIDSIIRIDPNNPVPGLAITIIKDGSVITRKQLGMANLEHRIAFTHNTPVRLGYSGTREFMCAGLALMEANGLLKFNDKLRSYFPLLPAWSSQLTIQDICFASNDYGKSLW